LREEALDRILWETSFGTCRKTGYVIKEINRISAETFLATADKLLSQTSQDLFLALSCDLITRHYYPSCPTQPQTNSCEMELNELRIIAVHVAQVAAGRDLSPYNENSVH